MFLVINGEDYDDIPDGLTVAGLVKIELNREVVSKSAYEATVLSDRDQLEIIHFIGGG